MTDPRATRGRVSSVNRIQRAIDRWARSRGLHVRDEEHRELAHAIRDELGFSLRETCAAKGLLLDVDETGEYCNPRIVDWNGPEETLYPIDPATDEPVKEAVAAFALSLPKPEEIPEL